MQGLPEGTLHKGLIEAHGIVACIDGWSPAFQLCPDRRHHLVEARKARIIQHFRGNACDLEGHGSRDNPGQSPTPDFETVDFFQLIVCQNGSELQDLIKDRVGAGRLGVVKYKQALVPPDIEYASLA